MTGPDPRAHALAIEGATFPAGGSWSVSITVEHKHNLACNPATCVLPISDVLDTAREAFHTARRQLCRELHADGLPTDRIAAHAYLLRHDGRGRPTTAGEWIFSTCTLADALREGHA